jgi:hypothetical protein
MYLKLILLSVVLISIALVALAIRMLVIRQGRFPVTSIGKNKAMAERGITCVKHDEYKCFKNGKNTSCGC